MKYSILMALFHQNVKKIIYSMQSAYLMFTDAKEIAHIIASAAKPVLFVHLFVIVNAIHSDVLVVSTML